MQKKIKDVTRNLLIAHGYHKINFGVIAKTLQITTTDIHYYFGNKIYLVEIVVWNIWSKPRRIKHYLAEYDHHARTKIAPVVA